MLKSEGEGEEGIRTIIEKQCIVHNLTFKITIMSC